MQLAEKIAVLVNESLKDSPVFLVEVKLSKGNKRLLITLDGDKGVSIDDCTAVSRLVSDWLDAHDEIENTFHLDVSSPGATEPLQLLRQYPKHIGRKFQVKTKEGEVFKSRLTAVEGNLLTFEETLKKKEVKTVSIPFEDIKEARVVIEF